MTEEFPFDDDHEQFLIREGLDALAAYRAIRCPEIRAIAVRLLATTAEAEENGEVAAALHELTSLSKAINDLKASRRRY